MCTNFQRQHRMSCSDDERDEPFKDRDQPFKGRNKYFNLIAYYPHRQSLPPDLQEVETGKCK